LIVDRCTKCCDAIPINIMTTDRCLAGPNFSAGPTKYFSVLAKEQRSYFRVIGPVMAFHHLSRVISIKISICPLDKLLGS
jgi:hypothetical protein